MKCTIHKLGVLFRSSECIPVMEILHSSEPSDLQYLCPSLLVHGRIFRDN